MPAWLIARAPLDTACGRLAAGPGPVATALLAYSLNFVQPLVRGPVPASKKERARIQWRRGTFGEARHTALVGRLIIGVGARGSPGSIERFLRTLKLDSDKVSFWAPAPEALDETGAHGCRSSTGHSRRNGRRHAD